MEINRIEKELVAPVDLAGMLEQILLRPELTETEVAAGVDAAKSCGVAAVIVRPSDVDLAVRFTTGSTLLLGTVVDVPYGYCTPSVKNFAARDMLRRGVKQIDTVINTGKLVSRHFQYLESELLQMADACHQSGATLTALLESRHLSEELKIVACRICRRAGVDFIGGPDAADIPLLKEYAKDRLRLKWSGLAVDWQQVVSLHHAGCERVQSEASPAIVEAWKAKLAEDAETAPVVS